MARACSLLAVVLLGTLCVALASEDAKPYPAPLFAWSSSSSVLRSGRKWVSRSVGTTEVQDAVLALATPGEQSSLFQEQDAAPQLIVLFLEPNLLFGQAGMIGGTRLSRDVSNSRAIKNMIEGAKSSVVAPYTYDLTLLEYDEILHAEELEEAMVDFLTAFAKLGNTHVLVDVGDLEAAWSYVMQNTQSDRIRQTPDMAKELGSLPADASTVLAIVSLPSTSAADCAERMTEVMAAVPAETETVAVLTSDDLYVPSKTSEELRASAMKLDWVLRELEVEGNDTDTKVCQVYNTRWPEYVWEILLVLLLLLVILVYGVCCLLGLENPSHFDNPKEKNL